MVEPPEMVGAHVAAAPVFGGHGFWLAGEMGVGVPVVAKAGDGSGVAPVVVADAVGGIVHPTTLGVAGVLLFVVGEERPHVALLAAAFVELGHDRFGAMPEVFQHTIDTAFHIESHHDEAAFETVGVLDGRGVTPETAGAAHDRFVFTGVRE